MISISKLRKGFCILMLFFNSPYCLAEAPEILITPSRFKKNAKQNSRSVQVITSKQIKKSNYRNVIDLLKKAVGLDVLQNGGLGRSSSIFIRGAESDHTLVLIDGIRVNDPNVGSFDLADLQIDRIEKVEILRGASSAAYGSEAIGGVVNIITKEPNRDYSATLSALGGSYGTHSESLELNKGGSRLVNGLGLSYIKSDGISAANSAKGNKEDDGYENISLTTKNKLKLNDQTFLTLRSRSLSAQAQFDGFDFSIGAIDDPNFFQKRDLVTSGLVLESKLTEDLDFKSEVNYSNEQIEGKDQDTDFNNYKIRGENRFATISLKNKFNNSHTSSIGVDYLNRRAANKSNFVKQRDSIGVWLDHSYIVFEDFITNIGLRTERNNDFGSSFVYDVSPVFITDDFGSNIHSSIGTGYKAPSFNELYFPNFGNPNLDPERSNSYDLGYKQFVSSDTSFDLTLFYNKFNDLITFDSTTFLAANIAEASARGVESQINHVFNESLSTNFNYVYTDSEDKTTGNILPRRARHKVGFQVNYTPLENLDITSSFSLANSRRETGGSKMDNYELVDLSLSYAFQQKSKFILRIDNLLDEDYEEIPGYGVPGFSVYAGVEIGIF